MVYSDVWTVSPLTQPLLISTIFLVRSGCIATKQPNAELRDGKYNADSATDLDQICGGFSMFGMLTFKTL